MLAGQLLQFLQSKIKMHTLKVSFVKRIDTEILDAKLMHSQGETTTDDVRKGEL